MQATSSPGSNAGYSQRETATPARGASGASAFYQSGQQGVSGERAVGGELLGEFDGPVSALLLVAHGNGRVGLYRVGSATGALDPGRTVTGNRFVADAQARVAREQAAGAAMVKRVSDFWAKQTGHA